MIKYSQIDDIFSGLSFSCEEYRLFDDDDIELPYCVYIAAETNPVSADGFNYITILTVRLVLVDDDINSGSQQEVETIMNNHNIFNTKSIDFDDENRLYTFTYEFEALNDYEQPSL